MEGPLETSFDRLFLNRVLRPAQGGIAAQGDESTQKQAATTIYDKERLPGLPDDAHGLYL
jgi:hypothetical protein